MQRTEEKIVYIELYLRGISMSSLRSTSFDIIKETCLISYQEKQSSSWSPLPASRPSIYVISRTAMQSRYGNWRFREYARINCEYVTSTLHQVYIDERSLDEKKYLFRSL